MKALLIKTLADVLNVDTRELQGMTQDAQLAMLEAKQQNAILNV